MTKKTKTAGMLMLVLLAASGPLGAAAHAGRDTVATVGTEKIDSVEFEAKAAAQERSLKRKLTAPERQEVLQALVNQRLLVAEARSQELNKKDELRRMVDDYERQLLSSLIYDSEIGAKVKVSEDEVKKFFDTHPQAFEVRQVSQILIKASDGAQAKAAKLKAKATTESKTFAALAKLESDDANSKARGGDLGELRRGMMVPELEKAVFEAKPGSLLGPVKTEFGFHILLLRSVHQQTYAEVKEQLSRELGQKQAGGLQQKLLEELSKKHKITFAKDKP
jgi:parvulin-like peptidyl-prolyl isomerase